MEIDDQAYKSLKEQNRKNYHKYLGVSHQCRKNELAIAKYKKQSFMTFQ